MHLCSRSTTSKSAHGVIYSPVKILLKALFRPEVDYCRYFINPCPDRGKYSKFLTVCACGALTDRALRQEAKIFCALEENVEHVSLVLR